jgi:hypothetical protein
VNSGWAETRSRPREVVSPREQNFEALFRVPPTHRLLPVRSRSRGGLLRAVYWEHEEYDASGRLIARYKCFDERNQTGVRLNGWHKYDLEGRLVEKGAWLA